MNVTKSQTDINTKQFINNHQLSTRNLAWLLCTWVRDATKRDNFRHENSK